MRVRHTAIAIGLSLYLPAHAPGDVGDDVPVAKYIAQQSALAAREAPRQVGPIENRLSTSPPVTRTPVAATPKSSGPDELTLVLEKVKRMLDDPPPPAVQPVAAVPIPIPVPVPVPVAAPIARPVLSAQLPPRELSAGPLPAGWEADEVDELLSGSAGSDESTPPAQHPRRSDLSDYVRGSAQRAQRGSAPSSRLLNTVLSKSFHSDPSGTSPYWQPAAVPSPVAPPLTQGDPSEKTLRVARVAPVAPVASVASVAPVAPMPNPASGHSKPKSKPLPEIADFLK